MNELVQPLRRKTTVRSKATVRSYDADRSMADILKIATAEFADKGLSGARVDAIADATATSKRMIYYHFGSKEGLYLAVLEESYRSIREIESKLNLEDLAPEDALRKLVAFTFDYQQDNEAFIRLVMNENIHYGAHIGAVPGIKERNRSVIATLQDIIDKGAKEGRFRKGIDPVDLHMLVSALCFYNVSNRYTFAANFGVDMGLPKVAKRRREIVIETILRFCRK